MSNMTYGTWLRLARRSQQMTQGDLAEATGIGSTHLSKVERGVIELPEEDFRQRIHQALNTTEDDLVQAGILGKLRAPNGSWVYLRRDEALAAPDTALDQLRAYIKSGEIDEDGARAIVEWWAQVRRLREE